MGTAAPLRANDVPQDPFEVAALADALTGTPRTAVEKVSGTWYYRRSIPLSNFREAGHLCHSNFGATPNLSEWVGALMLRVPIEP